MSLDKKDLISVRDFLPSDYNFILATWLRGIYYGDSWYSLVPKQTFMSNYHAFLTNFLSSPNVHIKVCCLKEDPEVILGYSVLSVDGTRLHWVFCKKAWRKIGIAKSLVPETVKVVTHLTKEGLGILRNRPFAEFNPFALN